MLTAYNPKTKQKNVPIQDAVITRVGNAYLVKGTDGAGNKLTTLVNLEQAEAAVKAGEAKKKY